MATWKKAPPALVERFMAALPDDDRVVQKPMFGYPAAFAGGNMFAGLWQEFMVLRLAEADRLALRAIKGARVFEPMEGRPMKEYTLVPPMLVDQQEELEWWLTRGLEYAA